MFLMTKKEKTIIFFALTSLADRLNIKDDELITSEKQNNKIDKILENNKNVFKDVDMLKVDICNMFHKYVNKLK